MVSDTILTGLTNLFALFGAKNQVNVDDSKVVLSNYMHRHFGLRNVDTFIDIYCDLRDFYEASDIPTTEIIGNICNQLKDNIETGEKGMVLLRLMQFCVDYIEGSIAKDDLFGSVADAFGVDGETFATFCDFVEDNETKYVHKLEMPQIDGHITTLWMPKTNRMLFTYFGNADILLDDVPVMPKTFQTWAQSGVIKHERSGCRIYYSSAKQTYAKEQEEQDVEFCGRDINFRFPNSDNGLHDFSFTLHKGDLVAVMGGSGTGKSTLMSLLNGSMQPQSGTITINGHSIQEPVAKSLIGFVPQDDLLIEELTVYQNLWYTAKLCFEGMTNEYIDSRVTDVLRQLDLLAARDLKVGSAINKFISGGQRKRLNIALELIREPAILFLDEPTSGLSSTDTEKVINILKELTNRGKLIITNIHQPSSDVYKLFDRLWLLDKGGYPVFDGNPIEAITYFKKAANYADADTSTCPTCGNVNPEVVLNIIDEKALDSSGTMSDERKVTPQNWHSLYLENVDEQAKAPLTTTDVPQTDQKKPNAWQQFVIQLQRNFKTKVTNVQYMCIALLEAPILAAICAMLTHYSTAEGYTFMDNKNLVSYLFMAVIVAVFLGMSGSAEEIIRDRALLKREKFLNLSYGSYMSSKIVFMAIVTLIQTFLFVIVGNTIQGVPLFFTSWGILFLVAFLSGLIGLLLSQCLNSVVAIYISIPVLLIPQILLCGLVVNFSDLTPHSKTGNVPAIGNAIPSRWAYEALAVAQFTGNDYEKPLFEAQKRKYEAQYYTHAYLYEVQSQLETMHDEAVKNKPVKPEHLDVIKKAMPTLADISGKTYDGNYSYASLREYTDMVEDVLNEHSNRAVLDEDAIITRFILNNGSEVFRELKRNNYNLRLEEFCINADTKHTHDVVDGYIVPRVGFIYLTPRTHCGNAPFYSSSKMIGTTQIDTPLFNACVMLLICLILGTLLYMDMPGRYLRKQQ